MLLGWRLGCCSLAAQTVSCCLAGPGPLRARARALRAPPLPHYSRRRVVGLFRVAPPPLLPSRCPLLLWPPRGGPLRCREPFAPAGAGGNNRVVKMNNALPILVQSPAS
ncbi:hypothetical protein PF003_g28001 [Phytophthora fragariae]|nr:hypothetical protein PF003_g28001 [Phytophthora fragariae]